MDLLYKEALGESADSYWWFAGKRNLVSRLIKGNSNKILDIGCGTGADAETLAKFGEVCVIDNSYLSLKNLPKNSLAAAICGDAEELPYKDNVFDYVLLLDVLEHIKDEKKSLAEALRVLKKNGFIVLTVPALAFLYSRHDIALKHYRRYSKKNLRNLFGNLKIIKLGYWNFTLGMPIVLFRLPKLAFRAKARIDSIKFPKFINSIFTEVLMIENRLIDKGVSMPFGTTLFLVCKK